MFGITDPYNLDRFVEAQSSVYETVKAELRRGHKESHWMWFIFPQIEGLGHSRTAREFAIHSKDEAKAYLDHPILGSRLRECTRLVLSAPDGIGTQEIFGYPDYLKFHSSMTLFAQVSDDSRIFMDAIEKHFGGKLDAATLERL